MKDLMSSAASSALEALWSAPVGLAILDLDLRFVRVNDTLAALHGLTAAEHIGKTVLEVLPLQGPELTAPLMRVRDGGPAEQVEIEVATRHWRVSWQAIQAHGEVTGVTAMVLDISAQRSAERALERTEERLRALQRSVDVDVTARAQSEAALKHSEARFRRLFETNLLGILFWELGGGVRDANDEFLRMVGHDRADLEAGAIDWVRLTPPEHRAQDERAVESLRNTGKHAPLEKEYLRKDGSRVWVLVGSAIIAGDSGVGFVLDISQQKQAEAALRALNDRLEQADRRKDEFIAILAHELRNPLAPVRNAVHILKRLGPAEPRLERARDVIDRQVTHMARLIDDLLDVSRITRGKLALQTETCDLAAIARQTAEDYRTTLDAAGLVLVTPPASSPLWVEGDPIRLAQIVGNFLNNAGRFTEKGGQVEVRTTLDMTDGSAVIEIVDTGIGIDPGLLSRLFDPFSQASQDLARTKGGLGLGLALTKGLAELHGGGVTARSDGPGLGARFTLRIPLSKSHYPSAAPDEPQGSSGARLRILVVEDNHDAAEMLGELLELGGHEVKLAVDGITGVAVAQAFHPHVVISDIGLPGEMDGYAVARCLRAEPALRGVYLIALSGYADEAARRRSQDAGFDLHLAKPPDISLLERTLTEIAGR